MFVHAMNNIRGSLAHGPIVVGPLGLSRVDRDRLIPLTRLRDDAEKLATLASTAKSKRRGGTYTLAQAAAELARVRREVGLPAKRFHQP